MWLVTPLPYCGAVTRVEPMGEVQRQSTNVESFVANLPESFFALVRDGLTLSVLAEAAWHRFDFQGQRFIRFTLQDGGSVVDELIGDFNNGELIAMDS